MIYLVKIAGHDLCKVGFTNNIKGRLKSISCECPFEIEIHHIREGTIQKEYVMHYNLRDHHYRGEWFFYNKDVLDIFLNSELPIMNRPLAWRKEKMLQGDTKK